MKKILIVAAHPDDEVLGCGGTAARFIREGAEVRTLILGEGIMSRCDKRQTGDRKSDLEVLRKEAAKADSVLGIKKITFFDFPDNRFDTVSLLDIVKIVERIKRDFRPEVIFTHHCGDLNIDHRVTFRAVLTACRPVKAESVKRIYSFEVPSSTEWNYPNTFSPNVFFDIKGTIAKKTSALRCYKSEIRPFPHPRSEEVVMALAKWRGSTSGFTFAEAFEAVRILL